MSCGRALESAKIAAFATAAAIAYGILHDQITAHLCVEYFTVAHPPVFPTKSPFLLAIGWGIIATWWVGLPLGVGLALAAQLGRSPTIGLAELRRPIFLLMLTCGVFALLAGISGAALVAADLAAVPGGWDAIIPPVKHVAFTADAYAHSASYVTGTLGGLLLIIRTAWLRRKSEQAAAT